jgi:Protein ENHANCED DISEASE RESISTANCE 2, C-terminal
VRGATYLQNKHKQPSLPAGFKLTALEALITAGPELHISPWLPMVRGSAAPFLMPIHFTLPYGGKPMHLVCVFESSHDPTDEQGDVGDAPFARALAQFVSGASPSDDARRNSMLKMIPMVRPATLPAARTRATCMPGARRRTHSCHMHAT